MESLWRAYRVMSYICGTTLILLYTILILQLTTTKRFQHQAWFSDLARVVGVGHGVILYPIYLIAAGMFALRARVGLGTMALMLLAGWVPGLAFYMEHHVGVRYGMIKEKVS